MRKSLLLVYTSLLLMCKSPLSVRLAEVAARRGAVYSACRAIVVYSYSSICILEFAAVGLFRE